MPTANRVVRKPAFYWLSLLAAIGAMIVNSAAWSHSMKAARLKAIAIHSAQRVPPMAPPEWKALAAEADNLYKIGSTAFVLSLICLVIALVRRESGWYLILYLLICIALLSSMIV